MPEHAPQARGEGVPAGRAGGHGRAGRHQRHRARSGPTAASSSRSRSRAARSPPTAAGRGKNIFNGGMRVDVTAHERPGRRHRRSPTLAIQCRGCDEHPGVDRRRRVGDGRRGLQPVAGSTRRRASPRRSTARRRSRPTARRSSGARCSAATSLDVGIRRARPWWPRWTSTSPRARRRTDGATGGDDPPRLAGYDVANTDFFERPQPVHRRPGRDVLDRSIRAP